MIRTRKIDGFTLVELMIAIVISLILLVGVLQIMLSNRSSLRTQSALAGLQSRARLLNVVLDDAVATAGYHVDPIVSKANIFAASSGTPPLAKGSAVAASSSTTLVYLRVRFQAAGGLHDCLGNRIGSFPSGGGGTAPVTSLTTQESDFVLKFDSGTGSLYCQAYSPKAGTAQPLFNNIRTFKMLFGIDTNGDGSADEFKTTLDVADQTKVVSIRVQALLQTEKRVLSTAITRTFHFLDGTTLTVDNSRRAFLLFDRTVALKNNLS